MKLGYKLGIVATLIFLGSLSASAAELAILRNGFAIRHERRETLDTVTRLYLLKAPDNYIDVPTAEIVRFEEVDSPLPPAVRSAPARDRSVARVEYRVARRRHRIRRQPQRPDLADHYQNLQPRS